MPCVWRLWTVWDGTVLQNNLQALVLREDAQRWYKYRQKVWKGKPANSGSAKNFDAKRSPTLACLAPPLAARVQQHPCTSYHMQCHTEHTHLTVLCPGLPRWAGTRMVKPIWILLKQETVCGSGISWTICKSEPCSRPITMPAPHHSVFLQAGCPSCRPTNSVRALKAMPYRMSLEINSVDRSNKNWLPWRRPLRDRKTNFRLIIYSHSSTEPANLAKIGAVDFEITGPTQIDKNKRQFRDYPGEPVSER